MRIIYSQPFVITTRKIDWGEQKVIETENYIDLYEDQIVTPSHRFGLNNIMDVSYKLLSDHSGLLYLHTNQGVFPFKVKSSPDQFVKKYNELKKM